jgi:hypothetical protein
MRRRILPAALLALAGLALCAFAGAELVLNGKGMRTKLVFGSLYELALYLPKDMVGAHNNAIIQDARPMELVMTLKSSMVTRPRLVQAMDEGLEKAAKSGYASNKTKLFTDQFDDCQFQKGDVVVMRWENGGLVTLYRTPERPAAPASEKRLGRIADLELKQALYAIWLGNAPVQESLKKGLLGQ